jgi:hypothetical protein
VAGNEPAAAEACGLSFDTHQYTNAVPVLRRFVGVENI